METKELINRLARESNRGTRRQVSYQKLVLIWLIGVALFFLIGLAGVKGSEELNNVRVIQSLLMLAFGVVAGLAALRLGFPDLGVSGNSIKWILVTGFLMIPALILLSLLTHHADGPKSLPPSGGIMAACVCSLQISACASIPGFFLIALVRRAAPLNSVLTVTLSILSGGLLATALFHLCCLSYDIWHTISHHLLPILLLTLICMGLSDRLLGKWEHRVKDKLSEID